MKKFHQVLKESLQVQGLSVRGFAETVELDRGFLQGIISGKKKLPYNRFADMIDTGLFTAVQVKEMSQRFFAERYGEGVLEQFKYIERGLAGELFKNLLSAKIASTIKPTVNTTYKNKQEIMSILAYAIEDENSDTLYTNFDFDNIDINATVLNSCIKGKFNNFVHFVKKTTMNSLSVLFNSVNYADNGYLTYICSSDIFGELLPYFVLTDNYFIRFDDNMNNAIVLDSASVQDIYRDKLEQLKDRCTVEVHICVNVFNDIEMIHNRVINSNNMLIGFDNNLCGTGCDREIMEAIATDEIKKLMPGVVDMITTHYSLSLRNNTIDYIISLDAIKNFVLTGRIWDFPSAYADVVPTAMRAKFLSNIQRLYPKVKLTNPIFYKNERMFTYVMYDNILSLSMAESVTEPYDFRGKVTAFTEDIATVSAFKRYHEFFRVSENVFTTTASHNELTATIKLLESNNK